MMQSQKKYNLKLSCFLYDAFGIDTDDLVELGAPRNAFTDLGEKNEFKDEVSEYMRFQSNLAKAMNAWWILQHSYGFPPLITRITMEKEYEIYVG